MIWRVRGRPGEARRHVRALGLVLLAAVVVGVAGCGKKGPPLPPLVRIPAPPGEMAAERRGETVAIGFSVTNANNDRTRPANVDRVEVYAITAPTNISEDNVRRFGERIATVLVNPPTEPDDPPRPVAGGVDQGARVSLTEILTAAMREPVALPAASTPVASASRPGAPLLPPPAVGGPTRIYMAVPMGGRRTGPAARAVVPLVDAPAPPSPARVAYDEDQITVTWNPPADRAAPAADSSGLLPSRPLVGAAARLAYHVYEISTAGEGPPAQRRLTTRPVETLSFADPRVVFGEERCYAVRAVQRVGALAIESDAPPVACETLVDTFPPRPPTGLQHVASDGAITLIWDPSDAADLAGYLVLRGQPGGTLAPMTPAPHQGTTFVDTLPSGTRAIYAVQAVDSDGNVSEASATVEDTAR